MHVLDPRPSGPGRRGPPIATPARRPAVPIPDPPGRRAVRPPPGDGSNLPYAGNAGRGYWFSRGSGRRGRRGDISDDSRLIKAPLPRGRGSVAHRDVEFLEGPAGGAFADGRRCAERPGDWVVQVNQIGDGISQIQFILKQSFGGSQVPLMVWVDGSSSAPVNITVR